MCTPLTPPCSYLKRARNAEDAFQVELLLVIEVEILALSFWLRVHIARDERPISTEPFQTWTMVKKLKWGDRITEFEQITHMRWTNQTNKQTNKQKNNTRNTKIGSRKKVRKRLREIFLYWTSYSGVQNISGSIWNFNSQEFKEASYFGLSKKLYWEIISRNFENWSGVYSSGVTAFHWSGEKCWSSGWLR